MLLVTDELCIALLNVFVLYDDMDVPSLLWVMVQVLAEESDVHLKDWVEVDDLK